MTLDEMRDHGALALYAELVLKRSPAAKTRKSHDPVKTCIDEVFDGNEAEFEEAAIAYVEGGCGVRG